MSPKKSSEITELAELVRESLELGVPVDVLKAVDRLGGSVSEVDAAPGKPEAAIKRKGDRFVIVIQKDNLPARKRFSLAHELGHLFLHMGYLIDPRRWGSASEYRDSVYNRLGYGVEEEEANLFAAALLMPEKEFRRAVSELSNRQDLLVKELASRFKTSAKAAVRRGEELGVFRVNSNGFE